MKIAYSKLKNSIDILKKISDLYLDLEIALNLYENIKLIDEKMIFYSKSIQKIIEKYAARDDSGNIVLNNKVSFGFECKEGEQDKLYREVNQLENLEVDIDLFMISKEGLFDSLKALQKNEPHNPDYKFKVFDFLAIDYMLE